jgi:hypothetical protein
MPENTTRTVTITSPAPAYYRNQTPLRATHRIANALPDGSVIGTACGRIFNQARSNIAVGVAAVTCRDCRK